MFNRMCFKILYIESHCFSSFQLQASFYYPGSKKNSSNPSTVIIVVVVIISVLFAIILAVAYRYYVKHNSGKDGFYGELNE